MKLGLIIYINVATIVIYPTSSSQDWFVSNKTTQVSEFWRDWRGRKSNCFIFVPQNISYQLIGSLREDFTKSRKNIKDVLIFFFFLGFWKGIGEVWEIGLKKGRWALNFWSHTCGSAAEICKRKTVVSNSPKNRIAAWMIKRLTYPSNYIFSNLLISLWAYSLF